MQIEFYSTKTVTCTYINTSDVVETETWLKFRDETETETSSKTPRPRPRLESSNLCILSKIFF